MKEMAPRWESWLPIIVCFLLAGVVTVGTTMAEEAVAARPADQNPPAEQSSPGESKSACADEVKPPLQAAPGMMIFLDPETGRITATPTAEQRARLQAMIEAEIARREQGPEVELVRRPDGSVIARLNGRYQEFVGAYRLPDGTVVVDGQVLPAPSADR